jgi:hypothetical protein
MQNARYCGQFDIGILLNVIIIHLQNGVYLYVYLIFWLGYVDYKLEVLLKIASFDRVYHIIIF